MHLNLYARIAFHGHIQPHPPSTWHYTSGYMGALTPPFDELASISKEPPLKKNMDCRVSMLLGIMVLSHLPRDSKGEDSFNTGISMATYYIPIQDSVREMLQLIVFDWWQGRTSLKVVWRCAKMDNGRRSVTEGGLLRKHKSYADNWDLRKIQEVSYRYSLYIGFLH